MNVLTELLPGSTSSLRTQNARCHHNNRYDVFLSFRGADTRNTFTDHLYNTLLDADISTFLDDEEIETGEPLKPELESAIKSCEASIIILSKNYASSTWCLEELVLILEQQKKFNQIVIPIYYHVEPTDVRKQQSSFRKAMEKHKERMEKEKNEEKRSELAQKMQSWKNALTDIADLKGKKAKGRKESELIEEVVMDIHRRLSNNIPPLVGMDDDIEFIRSWLIDRSIHSADILAVVGMSGIGKTSLAKYIFRLHSSKFNKHSFIEGINRRCNEHFHGLLDLQKQLHANISKKILIDVNDVSVYTSKIENALTRRRVFVVLDDIGSLNQLDALLGKKCFYPGSKIIITAKDASLIKRCALFKSKVQPKYKKVLLNGLCKSASLELLCIHAFKIQKPIEGYKEVSKKLVELCEGHPLALQILGRSLQKQDVAYWKECIKGIKKEHRSCIKNALKMSIDSLPSENDSELFKHIACYFVGKDKDVTEIILNACDIKTKSGIKNLTDRGLLSVDGDNRLTMHQLVQEMGRDLVCQESPKKPWKRSRLWCHEESLNVLKLKKGKGNLLGLALDMRMLDKKKLCGSFELKIESLRQMDNLMLLQLNYVQLSGCFKNFPEELRMLCMHGSPLKSIHLDSPMENLVVLDMSYSNIEYFNPRPLSMRQKSARSCSRYKLLASLKILDLSFCVQLHNLGGFMELPALERLIVRGCINLIEVCESVQHCVELLLIDLSHCHKLRKLPESIGKLKKVKTLLLDGCSSYESQIEIKDMISADTIINIQATFSDVMKGIPRDLKFLMTSCSTSDESFTNDVSCLSIFGELLKHLIGLHILLIILLLVLCPLNYHIVVYICFMILVCLQLNRICRK